MKSLRYNKHFKNSVGFQKINSEEDYENFGKE